MREPYLTHHGILGQKWGVRRYRNYDGSYTKKGLARYNKSKEDYDAKKSAYDAAKNSGAGKSELTALKTDVKGARKQMNKDYRQLKNDYNADKGKNIYKTGDTITSKEYKQRVASLVGSLGSLALGKAVQMSANMEGSQATRRALAYGGLGAMIISGGVIIKEQSDIKKLRAYYAH